MALIGVNIYETRKYISKLDKDVSNPTKFEIGILDPDIRAYIENKISSFEVSTQAGSKAPARASMNLTERNLLVCKFGLKGIDNFIHPQTKKPVKLDVVSVSIHGKNYSGVSDEILKMLGNELRMELAEEILRENTLSGDEIKN